MHTKIGVSCPSKSRRPFANAAADICYKNSLDTGIAIKLNNK